ncbi:MAG: S1 RNA-binding domain-containing protein [Myxococcales bacterium]|nr:S1 RNA-binding domain-containing protein [Myxococcales bacterium]
MSSNDDFASLMESSVARGGLRSAVRLTPGETVEGTVIQIGADSVFVDVGTARDARIDRGELVDKSGKLTVAVGDKLRATVVEASSLGARLSLGVGRGGQGVDAQMLEAALTSGAPVAGQVSKAVKAGLEVDIAGVRAFCPASQVELSFVQDLAPYVGQTLDFRILEIKDGGRSVIVSRRALLEADRAERARELQDQLKVGADMEGTVSSVQKYGALVDLGGIDGLVHISELAHQRVDRVEDVVQVGECVSVRVLSIEHDKKGLRVRLSLKALVDKPQSATPTRDEVLEGEVSRLSNFGVFVETPKGEGLVPLRELPLAPGSDHRRAYPVGHKMQVVVVGTDPKSGKARFSVSGVARVLERNNYRDYRQGSPTSGGGSLGSLGDLLRAKLGIEETPAAEPTKAAPAAPPAAAKSADLPKVAPGLASAPAAKLEPAAKPAPAASPEHMPDGVHRRKR